MARLPSTRFLIQQVGGVVICFEEYTEREIVRFDPGDINATAQAQQVIHDSELSDEDKSFAHLWSGYFYAHAGMSDPEEDLRDRAPNRGALAEEPSAVQALATLLHSQLCGGGPECGRWNREPPNSHRDYYENRAQGIFARLEPEIGAANVPLAARVILDEVS